MTDVAANLVSCSEELAQCASCSASESTGGAPLGLPLASPLLAPAPAPAALMCTESQLESPRYCLCRGVLPDCVARDRDPGGLLLAATASLNPCLS